MAATAGMIVGRVVTGTSADDTLTGGYGDDLISGGLGDDVLWGGAGNDSLFGGEGSDLLIGSWGADRLDGGSGVDTASYASELSWITVDLSAGRVSDGDILWGIERVVGTAYADELASAINGTTLIGGRGDDIYRVENAGVLLVEDPGGGIDEVRTALSTFALAAFAGVDNLSFVGTGGFVGTGNALDNVIAGGESNDILGGEGGNDRLIGGGGVDVLDGGEGSDIADYSASDAPVFVNLGIGVASGGHAQGDVLLSIEGVLGTVYADVLIASASGGSLDGGAGADVLVGGAGYDTVRFDSATSSGVVVDLQSSNGNSGDAAGDSYSGIEAFVGSPLDDTFIPGGAARAFDGGLGKDTLVYADSTSGITLTMKINGLAATGIGNGGLAEGHTFSGFETIVGTAHDDVYVFDDGWQNPVQIVEGPNGGTDEVRTFYSTQRLAIDIENLTYLGVRSFHGYGNASANIIKGGPKPDALFGYGGGDTVIGGDGDDTYILNVRDGLSNTIVDFNARSEHITLHRIGGFSGFEDRGVAPPATFEVGREATSAETRLVYDRTAGILYYDPDGLGGVSQEKLVMLTPGMVVSNNNILIG